MSDPVILAIVGGVSQVIIAVLTLMNRKQMRDNHAENTLKIEKVADASKETIGQLLLTATEAGRAQGHIEGRAAERLEGMPVFWKDNKGVRHETLYRPPAVNP